MTKAALKAELLAALQTTLEALERAHADTTQGATHAEAKPENDKDTRAIEASYLARGQAMRIEELKAGVAAVKALELTQALGAATLGSLVHAEEDEATVSFFIAPAGGGTRLSGGVQVLTPQAPLGAALLGKQPGDEVELLLGGKTRVLLISTVT